MDFSNLAHRFLPKHQRPPAQPPPGFFDDGDDRLDEPPRRSAPRPSASHDRSPPLYDYSLTRCTKVRGQILEHRRLNAPLGCSRKDCWPHAADIDYLRDRAERLRHTIVLETSEELARIRHKFGSIPGIIFITEYGRVVSRGDEGLVMDNFSPRPGPELEYGKLRRVFSLCNMADAPREFIEAIVRVEFQSCDVSESLYGDEVAEVRSF